MLFEDSTEPHLTLSFSFFKWEDSPDHPSLNTSPGSEASLGRAVGTGLTGVTMATSPRWW